MNGNGKNGRDGIFTRVPETQIIEERKVTRQSEVGTPVAQSRHLALGWAGLGFSFIAAILAFGPTVFWLAVFVVGTATFLWFLVQAARTEYTTSDGGRHIGVAPSEALTGLLVTLLFGVIAWSLWRIVAELSIGVMLPAWLASWLPKVVALVSLLGLIFSVAYIIHLEPAFLQELLYRSPPIEQALGNLAHQPDAPWWTRRDGRPEPKPLPPETLRVEHWDRHPNGMGKRLDNFELPGGRPLWEQVAKKMLNNGTTFSEPNFGKLFGGRGPYVAAREALLTKSYIAWRVTDADGNPVVKQGVMLTRRGELFLHALLNGHPPPHPVETENVVRGG